MIPEFSAQLPGRLALSLPFSRSIGGGNPKFCLGHVKLEMPNSHPGRDEFMSLEFRGEI